MDKGHSLKIFAEGNMRRNVQIRPGQIIPPKPQGVPVSVPRSWLSSGSASSGKNAAPLPAKMQRLCRQK